MTLKTNEVSINEIYSEPPKKFPITKKSNVCQIDGTWSSDILNLENYGPEKPRSYRYIIVVIDNFSKFGWTLPLKNKNAQTVRGSFENILITSNRKQNITETDR